MDSARPSAPERNQDGRHSNPHTDHDNRPSTSLSQGHESGFSHSGQSAGSGSGYRGDNENRLNQGDTAHASKQYDNSQMNEQDGMAGGKRRHVSGGSDSQSQPSAKRPALRLGIAWLYQHYTFPFTSLSAAFYAL